MIKKILKAEDKALRKKSRKVKKIDKKIRSLIKDLKDTLVAQEDPEGIGLAAPQIGKRVRVFVTRPNKKIKTFINPEILEVSDEKSKKKNRDKIMEGCLSIPHFYGPVKRSAWVKIKYKDEDGNEKTEKFEGVEAQIIMHEIDHLNGVLFVDRLLEQDKPLYEYVDGEWEKVEI